jgi:hypothetical protein
MNIEEMRTLFDIQQRRDVEFPDMRREVLPNVVRHVRPAPGMSFILYSRLDETNADAAIEEQIAYFQPLNQRFEWKVYTHDTPSDLVERLTKHGFDVEDPDAVMVLDLEEAPAALLQPVTSDVGTSNVGTSNVGTSNVRRITRPEQLPDVIQILEQVWGEDFAWVNDRHAEYLNVPGYFSSYVAYVDNHPACVGWTFFYPNSQFAGLWGGSTVAEYRGRGLYTAVLAARAQEAIERGYRFMTIDASPMSRPIVAKHGFRLLTYAHACEWKGVAEPTADG